MIINKQFFLQSNFDIYSESYVVKSVVHGVQSSTKGKGAFEGGRKVSTLHRHLEGVNRRHMDIEYHNRISNTFQRAAFAGSKTPRDCVLSGASSSTSGGGAVLAIEGCHLTGQQPWWLLFNSVSGPQEG